ncbi:D-arabinono-1,4-lactone oxidase, partial [Dietzia sp.]|uniref:D-arabinono-1,4-lactone oxidase n=1 Tax=Dietzia sp. TaxID=1871616 RepID=UPI002FD91CFB
MASPSWSNWSRTATWHPLEIVRPTTTAELSRLVSACAESGVGVKCVGASHSFTPCAATDGVMVTLDDLTGVESVVPLTDAEGRPAGAAVTLWAGTRLADIGPLLWDLGLSQENLGDIDTQSIAGAISTGTHGTGLGFGAIPTTVLGVQIVTGTGEIVDCDAEHSSELFEAARLGIGAVGILSKITIRCVPAFGLAAEERPGRIDEPLEDLAGFLLSDDHVEFFWFPHTDLVEIKKNHRMGAGKAGLRPKSALAERTEDFLSNTIYEGLCRTVSKRPSLARRINEVSGRAMGRSNYSDRSYKVFASARRVRFRETEFSVSLADAPGVIDELRSLFDSGDFHTPFPIEVRGTGADELWLSTSHGRDSVHISVHQYVGIPDDGLFARVE